MSTLQSDLTAVEPAYPVRSLSSRTIKRLIDFIGAFLGLLVAFPVMALIGVAMRLTSSEGILFRQVRIGKDGERFILWKFRTMHAETDADFNRFMDDHPQREAEYRRYQKLVDDPRLTTFGRFLRKTSLDELPQLWNVLKGDMSLVGPRPILPEQIALYGPALIYYQCVRPGITGLWQVSGRNCLSFQERIDCDLHYLTRWSLGMDLKILIHTPEVVIHQKGAF